MNANDRDKVLGNEPLPYDTGYTATNTPSSVTESLAQYGEPTDASIIFVHAYRSLVSRRSRAEPNKRCAKDNIKSRPRDYYAAVGMDRILGSYLRSP